MITFLLGSLFLLSGIILGYWYNNIVQPNPQNNDNITTVGRANNRQTYMSIQKTYDWDDRLIISNNDYGGSGVYYVIYPVEITWQANNDKDIIGARVNFEFAIDNTLVNNQYDTYVVENLFRTFLIFDANPDEIADTIEDHMRHEVWAFDEYLDSAIEYKYNCAKGMSYAYRKLLTLNQTITAYFIAYINVDWELSSFTDILYNARFTFDIRGYLSRNKNGNTIEITN